MRHGSGGVVGTRLASELRQDGLLLTMASALEALVGVAMLSFNVAPQPVRIRPAAFFRWLEGGER